MVCLVFIHQSLPIIIISQDSSGSQVLCLQYGYTCLPIVSLSVLSIILSGNTYHSYCDYSSDQLAMHLSFLPV
jgi:hypothetical protein